MIRDILEQIKKKELGELEHAIAEMKEKSSKLLFDLKSGKTAALKDIRSLRKDTATYMTILKEKQRTQKTKGDR